MMQRCPYLHEMKERLLGQSATEHLLVDPSDRDALDLHTDPASCPIGTIVKLNSDGYGSHTSPSHQLVPVTSCNLTRDHDHPKNAKTSLFIIMSFIYAKLLVVVCIAYVVSEVVTQGLPLPYYEAFFTYLYGASILFLLYVFCFLLQESTCCQGSEKEKKPVKPKKEKKDKENKKNQKKEKKEKKEKDKKDKEKKDEKKDKDEKKEKEGASTVAAPLPPAPPPGQRNSRSNIFQEGKKAGGGKGSGESGCQEKLIDTPDLESGIVQLASPTRKRKTSQSNQSHGSFFLRVGAIAFGLGTMIYNGLELGSFFEIPFNSSCYQILRGVNPILQMVFTFMQMYFIFMNSRLNIHRFKVIARFGLMHIVATNLCVWVRTLVLESQKEISAYLNTNATSTSAPPTSLQGGHFGHHQPLDDLASTTTTSTSTTNPLARFIHKAATTVASSVGQSAVVHQFWPQHQPDLTTWPPTTTTIPTTSYIPSTTTLTPSTSTLATTLPTTTTTTTTEFPFINILQQSVRKNLTEVATEGVGSMMNWQTLGDSPLAPAALVEHRALGSNSCERINIMGTIVQDSAPYLYPFIIEYSLIGAAVIFVMWRHIGRYPRYQGEEELEHRLEVILSRRAVAMAQAQHHGRMDCVGASKGLFLGLLLLVASLICLILFFVLIHNPKLSLLAIYLADTSHCVLMAFSIVAIIIGFIRVQGLKFHGDDQSDLNDILLRVSAFGLFVYAVFSIIAGSLNMMTSEPNLLVMITGILAVFQVVLQLLFIADVSRRRVHLPEHDRSKPGRQVVTFLLIANVTMWIIYTFEMHKVVANPVQLDFYGFLAWSMVQRITLPLCIFHRFHSAVTLAEIWKTSYKPQ